MRQRGKGPLLLVLHSNFPWEGAETWPGLRMVGEAAGPEAWVALCGLSVPASAMRRVNVILFNPSSLSNS